MKDKILEVIKERQVIPVRSLQRLFGINPANEEDRKKVWELGQGVAELYRGKWIDIGTATGERVCYAV